jgi:hypothetical protein
MTRPHRRSLAAILSLTTPAAVTLVACSLNRPQMYLASAGPVASAPPAVAEELGGHNTESYDRIDENPFLASRDNPVSTFSIDVDTASYANVRRFLNDEHLPPLDAVRIEELVNYFHYADPPPDGAAPLAARTEVGPCPWAPDHRLLRIGLRARNLPDGDQPARNLVFLVDVSGSMFSPYKLPLVKRALGLLARQLGKRDRSRWSCTPAPPGWCCAQPPAAITRRSWRRSRASRQAARPTAARGSSSPTRWRSDRSSRAASTG